MAINPKDKVYLSAQQLKLLANGGRIIHGADTYEGDEDTIYLVPDDTEIVQTTGNSSTDVMSQAAVTLALAGKVDKIIQTGSKILYGVDSSGDQTGYLLSVDPIADNVAQRDAYGQLKAETVVSGQPGASDKALANKGYVDTELSKKVDSTAQNSKVYGTDSNGSQTLYSVTNAVSSAGQIPLANANGILRSGTNVEGASQPVQYNDLVRKDYVDTTVASSTASSIDAGYVYDLY